MSDETARERYKLVIGIDFEKPGDDALAEALRMAREHPNDELHVVHVVKVTGETHSAKEIDRIADEMQQSGKKLKVRVLAVCDYLFPNEEWEQDMVFHVRLGDPAEALVQVAVDYEAHMIVVGTHARRGVQKLLLGSVAEKLMRIARMPVLVARERNLEGVKKSDKADEAREGELLSDTYEVSERVRFGGGGRHIAGLL